MSAADNENDDENESAGDEVVYERSNYNMNGVERTEDCGTMLGDA